MGLRVPEPAGGPKEREAEARGGERTVSQHSTVPALLSRVTYLDHSLVRNG